MSKNEEIDVWAMATEEQKRQMKKNIERAAARNKSRFVADTDELIITKADGAIIAYGVEIRKGNKT
jgi:hypothetical protein